MTHHGHGHSHGHSGMPVTLSRTATRVVVVLLVAVAVASIVGAVALWPSRADVEISDPTGVLGAAKGATESGEVVAQFTGDCGSAVIGRIYGQPPLLTSAESSDCRQSIVRLSSGPDEGSWTVLEFVRVPGQPEVSMGDNLRLVRHVDAAGAPRYAFDDFTRSTPLLFIVLLFAAAIIGIARWRGLRALIGLAVAFGVVALFTLPALLQGGPPLPIALVTGAAILYAVLYLAHGVNLRTSAALLGTLASMAVAAALSIPAIHFTHLTGLSDEQNVYVSAYIQNVSITGLLLAGFIIGALGVLNDVTITQAGAAFELAELDPAATRQDIFTAAMRVGRDHIASTVYTLVLAYAGGALPLLLIFTVADAPIVDILTGEAVAIEIVRACVGGIALALSVPLTTAIAVLLARPLSTGSRGRHARA